MRAVSLWLNSNKTCNFCSLRASRRHNPRSSKLIWKSHLTPGTAPISVGAWLPLILLFILFFQKRGNVMITDSTRNSHDCASNTAIKIVLTANSYRIKKLSHPEVENKWQVSCEIHKERFVDVIYCWLNVHWAQRLSAREMKNVDVLYLDRKFERNEDFNLEYKRNSCL